MNESAIGISTKVYMVTGANRGIGRATAQGLAKMGATVILVCRDRDRGEAARDEIIANSGNDNVELFLADLASQESVRQLSEEFKGKHDQLHVLVNNAGIYRTKRSMTEDGIELHFAVNYLAPFMLTNLLLDKLKRGAPSRVVNLVGIYHRKATIDFDDLMSEKEYSASDSNQKSKLALVLYTYELARRLEGSAVSANCLHPGAVATEMLKSDPDAPAPMLFFYRFMKPFIASQERGAESTIYLATSPAVEGVTGKFFVKKDEAESSPESYDRSVAAHLWEVSEALTGLNSRPRGKDE